MPKLKDHFLKLPVIGNGLRIVSNVVHAPRYQYITSHRLDEITTKIDAVSEGLNNIKSDINSTFQDLKNLDSRVDALNKTQDNIQKQFMLLEQNSQLSKPGNKSVKTNKKDTELFADDHLQDIFYTDFEDRFRGDESMIMERLKEYLDDFTKTALDFNKFPVLDIGSGRGEFIQLLKDNGVNAQGLDINLDMVDRVKAKGLKAEQGDALNYLQSAKLQSFGAITGFHIVEHIPFNTLLRIFKSAHQALVKDGFVLFETPNPENIIVGSCAFYMDPSHLHPIPPDLLAFALETCGFRNVAIRRIHPVAEYEDGELHPEVKSRFFGPRDYAVIGYK